MTQPSDHRPHQGRYRIFRALPTITRRVPQPVFHAAAIGWRTVRNFVDQEGVQWAGAIAFYLVLSVPPLLIAAFSVGVVLVGEETARSYLTNQVTQFLPAEQDLVERIVGETIQARGPAAAISLVFLVFSGSRVFASLIAAINVMWEELPEPGFWRRQITRIVMVVTVGGIFALAALADLVIAFAGDMRALPAGVRGLFQSQLIPAALAFAALFLLYRIVPRQLPTAMTAVVGAFVGMIALRVAQAGFTAYLATIGGFESAYGPIAQGAVLLTWALVASAVVLLGAHLVAVLNNADRRRSRSGPPRHPAPGERQARES
jgi:membrane protein